MLQSMGLGRVGHDLATAKNNNILIRWYEFRQTLGDGGDRGTWQATVHGVQRIGHSD